MAYKDVRQEWWKGWFERALSYDAFLADAEPAHRERWAGHERVIALTPEMEQGIASWKRTMNVIVLAGAWCGDCARQGPMLRAIASANARIVLRFVDNRSNPEFQDELRINGAEKVPVVVTLSEDFYEIGRFGDKHLSVYRRALAALDGESCLIGNAPPPGNELHEELSEWVAHFERQHSLLRLAPLLRRRYED